MAQKNTKGVTAQGKPVPSNAGPQLSKSFENKGGQTTSQINSAVSKSTNMPNDMSKSVIVPNKNEKFPKNVQNSSRSNSVLSKSLPSKIRDIQNIGKKGRLNKPQPDGEGNQSRTQLKLPGINENSKQGQRVTDQTKNVQNNLPQGKRSNNLANNTQKPEQLGQRFDSQTNSTQKNQANVSQKLPQIEQKWNTTPSGVPKPKLLGKGQRSSRASNTPISQIGSNQNETTGKNFRNLQTGSSVAQSMQGRSTRSEQPSRSSQTVTGATKKRKKRRPARKQPPPPKPQIIEYPAGITSVSLQEAQSLLDDIAEMKSDGNYDELAEFLYQLFQKCENLETGNYTRTEVEFNVKQFQDYNEGFHYRMESKPRGHALIITNYEFYKVPGDPYSYLLNNRPGAGIDADMGYLVTRKDNIKHWEMVHELKHMAETDHKKFDSFICVISSHGNLNQVFGCDGLKMTFSKEIRQFANEKCLSLAGKPKMFFLQSCQTILEGKYINPFGNLKENEVSGVSYDEHNICLLMEKGKRIAIVEFDMKLRTASTIEFGTGGTAPSRTASTVPSETGKEKQGDQEKSKFLVNDVDFLVGYSTLPGQLSYRHDLTGSWYLNALYRNIKENYETFDMVSILEDVNYDVSKKKDQYNFMDYNQVSMFSSSLRGPLFFH